MNPDARPALHVQVQLSSAVLRAGVSALLTQLGFLLSPPDAASPDLMVVDELFVLSESLLPDMPMVGLGNLQVSPAQLFESSQHGWAWLPSDVTPAELQAAVLGAAAGLVVVTPDQLSELTALPPPVSMGRSLLPELQEALTARERDVLDLVAQGLSNKRIALRLGISDNTVKFHLQALFGKLGVNSRAGAATRAIGLGLTFV